MTEAKHVYFDQTRFTTAKHMYMIKLVLEQKGNMYISNVESHQKQNYVYDQDYVKAGANHVCIQADITTDAKYAYLYRTMNHQ